MFSFCFLAAGLDLGSTQAVSYRLLWLGVCYGGAAQVLLGTQFFLLHQTLTPIGKQVLRTTTEPNALLWFPGRTGPGRGQQFWIWYQEKARVFTSFGSW